MIDNDKFHSYKFTVYIMLLFCQLKQPASNLQEKVRIKATLLCRIKNELLVVYLSQTGKKETHIV